MSKHKQFFNRARKQGKKYKDDYCHTPEYRTWISMRSRCTNKKDNNYKFYGKKGVKVCKRWDDFENFLSDMGRKPSPELTLDRRDPAGDYCKSNCRWITRAQNSRNTRRAQQKRFNKFIKFMKSLKS